MGKSRIFIVFIVPLILLAAIPVSAGQKHNQETGRKDFCSSIQEADGSPAAAACQTIQVPNNTLTDNGNGIFSLIGLSGCDVVVDGTRFAETSTGVQAAHDALGSNGGVICLDTGNYTWTGNVTITKNNVTIIGSGTATYALLASGTNTRMLSVSGTDFLLANTYFDANQAQNTTVNSMILISDGADRARFVGNLLANATSRCLSVKEITGLQVTQNNFSFCGNNENSSVGAIGLDGSIGARVINNRFINTQGTSVYLASGTTTSRTSEQTIVSGNWFYGNSHDASPGGGSDVMWSGGKTTKLVVSNNYFGGYADTAHGVNAINIGSTTKDLLFVVSNNVMDSVTGVGVETHGGHGIISGNVMTFTGSGSDQNGLYISSTPNETIVTGNYISGASGAGIKVVADSSQNASNIHIIGNIVKNTRASSAIVLEAATGQTISNVAIAHNTLIDDQGTPTQTYGISKNGAGTLSNIRMFDNYFSGNTIAEINPVLPSSNVISNSNVLLKPYASTAGATSSLLLAELVANGTSVIGFKPPDSLAADITWTLPSSDASGYFRSSGSGTLSVSTQLYVAPPSIQIITAGSTISADACGTIKPIASAGAVTTSTSNTFTAPSSSNPGCTMSVINFGSNNITLDNNSNFLSAGGADVVLTPNDSVYVGLAATASAWTQIAPVSVN